MANQSDKVPPPEEFPALARPPIREAVIEIRVQNPPETHLGRLALVEDRISTQYPVREERTEFSAGVQFRPGVEPVLMPGAAKPLGYWFRARDNTEVVQALLDRFAFSRLAPYTSWQQVRERALSCWDAYVACAKPVRVSRVSVRYINAVRVPLPIHDLSAFLRTRPEIAPELPQAIQDYMFRTVLAEPDNGTFVSVAQTIERQEGNTDEALLVLDIDVFKPLDLGPDRAALAAELDGLRVIKNRVFFSSLTVRGLERHR